MAKVIIKDSAIHGRVIDNYDSSGSIQSIAEKTGLEHCLITLNNEKPKDFNYKLKHNDKLEITPIPQGADPISWVVLAISLATAGYAYYQSSKLQDISDVGYDQIELDDPQRVATMRTQSNKARLDQPPRIVYGERRIFPDLAAAPLKRYEKNKQVIYYLLMVNRLNCEVADIKVGDTPVESFEHSYQLYQPNEIMNFFDARFIECGEVSRSVQLKKNDSVNVGANQYSVSDVYEMTPFYTVESENALNELEITLGGQGFYSTLYDSNTGSSARQELLEAYVQWIEYDDNGYPIPRSSSQIYNATIIDDSCEIEAATQAQADSYKVQFLNANNGYANPELNQFESLNTARLRLYAGHVFDVDSGSASILPFEDIPNNSNSREVLTDEFYGDFRIPLSSNSKRIEFRLCTKTKNKDGERDFKEDLRIAGARGYFSTNEPATYPDSVLALKLQVDDVLSAQSQTQISLLNKTSIPVYDGVSWTNQKTRLAAWAWLHILRTMGGEQNAIDYDQFILFAQYCEDNKLYFDGEFTNPTEIGKAIEKVAEVSRGIPYQRNGVHTVIIDRPSDTNGVLFNGVNSDIFGAKISVRTVMPGDLVGVEVQYTDKKTGKPKTYRDERDGITTYQTLRLPQITEPLQAKRIAEHSSEKKLNRNLRVEFTAGFQAQSLEPAKPIMYAPAFDKYGQNGQILAVNGNVLTLSEPVNFESGVDHFIYANCGLYAESKQFLITQGSNDYEVVADGHDIQIQSKEYPIAYNIGTATKQPLKLLVEKVTQSGDGKYTVTAVTKEQPENRTGWSYGWHNNWSN